MDVGWRAALGLLAWLAGYIVLIALVPRALPVDTAIEVVSASAAQGYNAPAAYWLALLWSLAIITVSALLERRARFVTPGHTPATPRNRLVPIELIIVFVVFSLAYFPMFAVRYGPYFEDTFFVTALFRMACGQAPFRDFEFLYGPLMLYPIWAWVKAFGVSMESYFGFLAVQEGLQFAALMAALQLTVKDRRRRYLIFLILAPFLINTLLGPNWGALRRLAPVFALLLAASRPFDLRANLAVAAIIGLHASYSHEYGAAALLGVGAIYGALLLGPHRREALRSGPIIATGAVIVWVLAVGAMLREDWPYYFETIMRVVSAMSQGHASFDFYWTVNSIAQFALLTMACMIAGQALLRFRGEARAGDLYLVGALAYALVTLKSGLTRADHWHLGAPFIALYFAFLLQLPTTAVRIGERTRSIGVVLIGVASLTYLVGIYPSGEGYARSYLRGARDVLTGVPRADISPDTFRGNSVEIERTKARPNFIALGRYLADPAQEQKPVLFYGRAWVIASKVGVCSQDFKLDDLMYSEFEKPERDFLERNPTSLVVMTRGDYERIFGLVDPDAVHPSPLRRVEKLAKWMTTVHRQQRSVEGMLLNRARDGVTGRYVRERYSVAETFGDLVVLGPR